MPDVSGTRLVMRRAIVSMLAGGGLTAVGFGGPLSGGALANAPVEPAPEQSSETTSTPAPETPTQTTTTSTTPTSIETGTTTTPAPVGGPSTTTTSPPPTTTQTQTTTPTSTTSTPRPVLHAPKVAVHRTQEATDAEAGSTTTTAAATPAPVPAIPLSPWATSPRAPQLAAAQSSALAAMMAGSAASTRALSFYRIPLFLLPIYKAAAVQYGVPWQILAAINEIETNYGTDQSVSTAGAVGWMQFMPADLAPVRGGCSRRRLRDPYNPVDAIFAAARYLRAAGAATDLPAAILAYNHSDEYVDPCCSARSCSRATPS